MATEDRRKTGRDVEEIGLVMLANVCNQTGGSVNWKNRKFIAKGLCAKNANDAAGLVNDAKIRSTIEAEANTAIGDLGCTGLTGCSAPRVCMEGKLKFTGDIVVTQPVAPANCRNTNAQGNCPAGETLWECTFRADVQAQKTCECVRPV